MKICFRADTESKTHAVKKGNLNHAWRCESISFRERDNIYCKSCDSKDLEENIFSYNNLNQIDTLTERQLQYVVGCPVHTEAHVPVVMNSKVI